MNWNLVAYSLYSCVTIFVIYYVGKLFHRNGRIFILRLFHGNHSLTDTTNNLLLVAYYLFNIGYSIVQLSFWQPLIRFEDVISSVAHRTGTLVLILGSTHYLNMLLIYVLSFKANQINTSKTITL